MDMINQNGLNGSENLMDAEEFAQPRPWRRWHRWRRVQIGFWSWVFVLKPCRHDWSFASWQFNASLLRDPIEVVVDFGEHLQIDWGFAQERQWFDLHVAGNADQCLIHRLDQWAA